MQDLEKIAKKLLYPIWMGISREYKQKYSRSIWQQFENNIRSAAYTSSLSKFFNDICQKLGVEIRSEHIKDVESVISKGNDKKVLSLLRDETATLVVLVRIQNDARKQELQDKFDWRKDEEEWIK